MQREACTLREFVSVVIPARNEGKNIVRCLSSLCAQTYRDFEVIVVDDSSTDDTSERVAEFKRFAPWITLIRNDLLPQGWTGKNWALNLGVAASRGNLLLFLDADVVLYPDAIEKAVALFIQHGVRFLSISPEQEMKGFWEKAVQPVVFDLLGSAYPFSEVNDPSSDKAAANGQFILVDRAAYDLAGGHARIGGEVLEDVALARNVKRAGCRIRFVSGEGIARCRMYGSLAEIVEGWSKNLYALLGGSPFSLVRALLRLVLFSVLPILVVISSFALLIWYPHVGALALISSLTIGFLVPLSMGRFKRSSYVNLCLYPLGSLMVIYILLLSCWRALLGLKVRWKGRDYEVRQNG
jgi:hypothetical protein